MSDPTMQELIDTRLISDLKARYVRLLDQKQWSELERLFADDFAFEGIWASRGGAAFVQRLSGHLADANTVHEVHLPEIEILSPTIATGIWPFSDIIDQRRNGLGMHRRGFGHYHERYVKSARDWRFSTMSISRVRVECEISMPDGGKRSHTCFSQEELIEWLGQEGGR